MSARAARSSAVKVAASTETGLGEAVADGAGRDFAVDEADGVGALVTVSVGLGDGEGLAESVPPASPGGMGVAPESGKPDGDGDGGGDGGGEPAA